MFYQGAPCKRGHQGKRYLRSNSCVECGRYAYRNKARDNKAKRAYRKRKPRARDWVAEYRARRRLALRLEVSSIVLARSLGALANAIKRKRTIKLKPAPMAGLTPSERYQLSRLFDLEAVRLKERAARAKRRARARGARDGSITPAHIAELWQAQGGCAYCGSTDRPHLDHMRPLSRGGHHTMANVQWLCQPCNQAKHATPDRRYRRLMGIPLCTPWEGI